MLPPAPPSRLEARRWGRLGAALVLGALLGLAPVLAGPAAAHSADPRVQSVLDAVTPALPTPVVVQVRPGIAAQLVADNPTAVDLLVLGSGGRPFLRLSRSGVYADLGSADFYSTSTPSGSLAGADADVQAGSAPAKWVRISTSSSWGWYDHRLHPQAQPPPVDTSRAARLADWQVLLRYGTQDVVVRGHEQFQPLLGTFEVTVGSVPAGLTVQALQGQLPGLFLSDPDGTAMTVLGRDGEPFLRAASAGLEVNTASRTWVEDQQARGEAAGPPAATPHWRPVSGTSYVWLDARLRYPDAQPPASTLRSTAATTVETWQVPVTVGGRTTAMTGQVRWVPEASAAALASGGPVTSTATAGQATWRRPVAIGVAALVVVAAVVLAALRRRRNRVSARRRD